jgi:imidazolonepropionase-like amidohydrolase
MAIVLTGGRIVDGTGSEPIENGVLIIEGDRIKAVGSMKDLGAQVRGNDNTAIDVSGKTVLPGLINAHEHLDTRMGLRSFQERAAEPVEWLALRAARNLLLCLVQGVTTVRDVGSKGGTNLRVREAARSGMLVGPRVYTCGQPIAMTGGHGDVICRVADGIAEVTKAAREQLRAGADLVKCMASGGYVARGTDSPYSPQYTVDELRAAFYEAHTQGRRTTVHAHPPIAIRNAVEAGVDCIEHAALVDPETAEFLADREIPVVPTLGEHFLMAEVGLEHGRPRWLVELSRSTLKEVMEHYKHLVKARVRLGVGTDVLGEMVREMELMAEGGLTPLQVIRAATLTNAEIIGEEQNLGSLEPGKFADAIVVDGNPVKDLTVLRNVERVFLGGVARETAALKQALGTVPY